MLSDRSYMREAYPKEKTSLLTWMTAAIIGSFALQWVLFSPWFEGKNQLVNGLALTPAGFKDGHLWTLATYWLLHSQKNLFHIGISLLGLYAVGRDLESTLGPRRFLGIFVSGLLLGGLFWVAVNWQRPIGPALMGTTTGVLGLVTLYAVLYPEREFRFLALFFFPVALKPKHLVLGLLALDLTIFAYAEVFHYALPFDYAASAHLGGMMAGWLYYRHVHLRGDRPERTTYSVGNSRRTVASAPAEEATDETPARPDAQTRAQLRAEVDRILDKINSAGLGALTPAEKRLLDEAKDLMSRP